MKRVFVGTLVTAAVLVASSACDDSLGGYVTSTASCSSYLRCDTCTPVLGCGWCTAPGGGGVCASDPDYCPTQEFSWTWDIEGCRVAADASVGSLDSAAPAEGSTGEGAPPPDAKRSGSHATGEASAD